MKFPASLRTAFGLAHALQNEPVEDVPDYLGGIFVNDQRIFVIGVLGVAIGSEGANKFPVFPLVLE